MAALAPGLQLGSGECAWGFMGDRSKGYEKMVAYSSIGHMGYVLLAAAAATPLSLLASVFQMISHGLISALLFLLVGVVLQKVVAI